MEHKKIEYLSEVIMLDVFSRSLRGRSELPILVKGIGYSLKEFDRRTYELGTPTIYGTRVAKTLIREGIEFNLSTYSRVIVSISKDPYQIVVEDYIPEHWLAIEPHEGFNPDIKKYYRLEIQS